MNKNKLRELRKYTLEIIGIICLGSSYLLYLESELAGLVVAAFGTIFYYIGRKM